MSDTKTKLFRVRDEWPEDQVRIDLPGGHVALVGREPKELPEILHREAYAKGCEEVKGGSVTTAPKTPPAGGSGTDTAATGNDSGQDGDVEGLPPVGPEEQAKVIKAKIKELLDGDNEEGFTGSGLPNLNVLSKLCGFQVKKDAMLPVWTEIKQAEGI